MWIPYMGIFSALETNTLNGFFSMNVVSYDWASGYSTISHPHAYFEAGLRNSLHPSRVIQWHKTLQGGPIFNSPFVHILYYVTLQCSLTMIKEICSTPWYLPPPCDFLWPMPCCLLWPIEAWNGLMHWDLVSRALVPAMRMPGVVCWKMKYI